MSTNGSMDPRDERREIVNAARVDGAFTKKQLEEWGVSWPPPPGWVVHLIMNGIPYRPASIDRGDDLSQDAIGREVQLAKGKSNV